MLKNIRIVLVNTSHPGNIGAVARAMKNMCLEQLVLVEPAVFPHADATARASGADDILAAARVCGSLDEAIADCRLVVGASARLRSVQWPQLDPRAAATRVLSESPQGPVAILFGRESSGLTNDELARCRYLVHIPANPDYSSLNIAMAVQVIGYELLMGTRDAEPPPATPRQLASAAELQGFFDHLQQALGDIGFADSQHAQKLMRRLRRLFLRAEPDREDVQILRGILSAAQGRKSARD